MHQRVCANGDQSSVWMSSSPILSFEAEPLLPSMILQCDHTQAVNTVAKYPN